MYYRITV